MKHDRKIKQLAGMIFSGFHGVKLEEKSSCLLWWPGKGKQKQSNNRKYNRANVEWEVLRTSILDTSSQSNASDFQQKVLVRVRSCKQKSSFSEATASIGSSTLHVFNNLTKMMAVGI